MPPVSRYAHVEAGSQARPHVARAIIGPASALIPPLPRPRLLAAARGQAEIFLIGTMVSQRRLDVNLGIGMQRFGEKVRMLRKRRGMTTVELAKALGYTNHGYISLIEQGKKTPTVAFVLKVARLFDVTTDQLLKDELEVYDQSGQ